MCALLLSSSVNEFLFGTPPFGAEVVPSCTERGGMVMGMQARIEVAEVRACLASGKSADVWGNLQFALMVCGTTKSNVDEFVAVKALLIIPIQHG
jgi:hypothetical protein